MARRSRLGDHLTEQNLIDLAAAVAAGRRATVYLNEATPSLGIPAGCSAKVVSVDGSTVLIRPKGVNDELPFEADELRMTRDPAAPAAPAKPKPAAGRADAPRARSATARAALDRSARAAQDRSAASVPAPTTSRSAKVTAPQNKSTGTPVPSTTREDAVPAAATPTDPTQADAAPAKRPARRTKEPAGVSVTLHATAGGQWTVTVTHGAKRPGKAAPVGPDAVERAVRELGDPAAQEAVTAVLDSARDAAAKRVEELSRQLEEARVALESLGT